MRGGYEQPRDEVLFARLHAGAALAAAPLRAIGRERHALDVAEVRNRDHHVLAVDEIFLFHLAFMLDDDGAAWRGELFAHRFELVLDDALDARARAQDIEIVGDLLSELVQLGLDLVAAERGQALQAQIENGFGLLGRELVGAVGRDLVARIVDQRDHRLDVTRRPVARHQGLAGGIGVGGGPDQLDHLIDIADRNGEPDQHVGAITRFAEQILGAAGDHLLAEGDEGGEQVVQIHDLRAAALERDHVGAEGGLQRRVAVELIEHDVSHGVALELDDDAIALAVGLVAQRGQAVDLLVAPQLADALDHRRLVHLVGNLADDDRLAFAAQRLDLHFAAHHDGAAALHIGGANARVPENDAAGRKVGAGNDADQVLDAEIGVFYQRDTAVDHLAEIVRRDVGRHADGDAACPVHQKVGKASRQDHRLLFAAVIVRLEVDGLLVDVVEQLHGRPGQPAFGVPHGRGRIAVDRAEIYLPVDKRQAHGEVLRPSLPGVVV